MAATRNEEREALKQIREIVESLGEESYVATAFEGVWNIAVENIELDFWNSCRWYMDNYQKAIEENEKIITEYEALERDYDKMVEQLATVSVRAAEYEAKLSDARNEIVKLKAKLYDYITSGD